MDNTLIIVPTEREAAFFASHGLRAHICGVGMAECAATTAHLLAEAFYAGVQPDLVVLAGVAGSYAGGLKIGDTVIVASETIADLGRRDHDGGFTPLFQKTYAASFVPGGGAAVRSNTVNTAGGLISRNPEAAIENMEGAGGNGHSELTGVSSGAGREEAVVENMEGAAFFAVCERFGVRAMEVRTVSNRVGEPVTAENLDLAARHLARDLENILRSCV